MYFDLEGRNFETPTIESAISWREQALLSFFGHLLLAIVVIFAPRLSFFEEMAERREARLEELAQVQEVERLARLEALPESEETFVFVQPRTELPVDQAPSPDAMPSDRDRVAMSPERSFDPGNRLPIAEGNSTEFIVTDDPGEGTDMEGDSDIDPSDSETPVDDPEPPAAEETELVETTDGDGEDGEFPEALSDEPGRRPDAETPSDAPQVADSSLAVPGQGPGDPDLTTTRRRILHDGLLGQANRSLSRSLQRQSFGNVSGDTGRYGPEIQFDTKGVEFGPWIRRFVAQIRRNWFVPYRVWTDSGHVVLTFNVHRDGRLTDLTVIRPSRIDPFNHSAANALRASNPTQPLPDEYPDDQAFFTVTFYFNETPPGRGRY